VAHVGSAHTEAELGLLLERARGMLADPAQGVFDLGVEPTRKKAPLVGPAGVPALFEVPMSGGRGRPRVPAAKVVGTCSRLLFDALTEVYTGLGFDAVGDETFRGLVIARIVEPTSILDTGRVLTDLGVKPSNEKTMRRTLTRAKPGRYRVQVAAKCVAEATTRGGRPPALPPLERALTCRKSPI
jgi:hypothetical protein